MTQADDVSQTRPLARMTGITKRFGRNTVLDPVDIDRS
jgi:hypothetical protein